MCVSANVSHTNVGVAFLPPLSLTLEMQIQTEHICFLKFIGKREASLLCMRTERRGGGGGGGVEGAREQGDRLFRGGGGRERETEGGEIS